MAKAKEDISVLVSKSIPRNFKYKFIIKTDEDFDSLSDNTEFDMSKLDTINNDALVRRAIETEHHIYDSTVIGKATKPTLLDNGIILSKKLVTKVGKALDGVGVGFFEFEETHYVSIKLMYERYDIYEIFILT